MIQRKQSIFLLLSALLNLLLLFIPNQHLLMGDSNTSVYLTPLQAPFVSGQAHYFAILINFICLLLAFVTIFLYTRRLLQIRLCYVLMVSWLIVALMLFFGGFVTATEGVTVEKNYLSLVIALAGILVNLFAARHIKKDIELLKSADRIR